MLIPSGKPERGISLRFLRGRKVDLSPVRIVIPGDPPRAESEARSLRSGRLCGGSLTTLSDTSLDPVVSYRSVEHRFMCPYCGEEISMILDLSVPNQVYIEDCEVCCNPIEISYTAEDDDLTSFAAKRLE